MGSAVLRSNIRRILEEDEQRKPAEDQGDNMMMEQMRHIHQLIIKQDGSENILKLVQAEELITKMILTSNVMEKMGG